jgi:hypothetical protein
MLDWLSRRVIRAPNGRGNPASFWWWCGHGIALLVLTLMTAARGVDAGWFRVVGGLITASPYAGQYVIRRRGGSVDPS